MSRSDAELTSAAQAGERRALDELLRRHYDRIFGVCRRITGNDSDAADAAQEALISIVRSLHRFDGRSSFSTWAYRIATNASLDELRRRRRRPWSAPTISRTRTDEQVDPDAGRPHRRHRRSDGDRQRVGRLSRSTSVCRSCSATSPDSTTPRSPRRWAIPAGTVKSRIARGRAALAQSLSSGNHPPSDDRPRTCTMNDEPDLELEAVSAAADDLATADERALVDSSPALQAEVESIVALSDTVADVVVPAAVREGAIAAALAAFDDLTAPPAAAAALARRACHCPGHRARQPTPTAVPDAARRCGSRGRARRRCGRREQRQRRRGDGGGAANIATSVAAPLMESRPARDRGEPSVPRRPTTPRAPVRPRMRTPPPPPSCRTQRRFPRHRRRSSSTPLPR